jgi:hypothetical protein
MRGGGEGSERPEDIDIDFSRISLTGNGVSLGESREFCDESV